MLLSYCRLNRRRLLTQRWNEKSLSRQLDQIAKQGESPNEAFKVSLDFLPTKEKPLPYSRYESLRRHNNPEFQDLTHGELPRMQEMRERHLMLKRKIYYLKTKSQEIDPRQTAKFIHRAERKEEAMEASDLLLERVLTETSKEDAKILKLEEEARKIENESRIRMELRRERLENSKLHNEPLPTISGRSPLDPIKRKISRRQERQAGLMQVHLQRHFSAARTLSLLQESRISVNRIQGNTARSLHTVFYTIISSNKSPEWIAGRLKALAPFFRTNLSVNLRQAEIPPLEFIQSTPNEAKKPSLFRSTHDLRKSITQPIVHDWTQKMKW